MDGSDCGQEPVRRPLGFSRQEIKTKAKMLGFRVSGTQEACRAFLRKDMGVRAGNFMAAAFSFSLISPTTHAVFSEDTT